MSAKANGEYVKYYVVAASDQNLTEIATRLLGDGSRSGELLSLNAGRKQPDGMALTNPRQLNPGWLLVLPWDAVGAGVQYGLLPDKAPVTTKPSTPPESRTTVPDAALPSTPPSTSPSSPPRNDVSATTQGCNTAAGSKASSDWASLRLAANQAWPWSRGAGQLVAVIDSGVDGALPQLSGRVAMGRDIITGSGRGDTDCLGSGTAMAGLIAAQPIKGSTVAGIAPDATVLPMRVVDKNAPSRPADGAAAIGAAVAAGATVIAIGSHVDINQVEVAKAVNAAVEQGAVVVVGAVLSTVPVNPAAKLGEGVLRVGGIGIAGQVADGYRRGGIDVVAPGVDVSSIGITGTGPIAGSGTYYAVAFVAGEAALVRSAHPELTPQQVAHRMRKTAKSMGNGVVPDGQYGWGLIDPAASVSTVLPEETRADPADGDASTASPTTPSGQTTLLVIVVLVALAAVVLLVFRFRRMVQADKPDEPSIGVPRLPTEPATGRPDDVPPGGPPAPPGLPVPAAAPPSPVPSAPAAPPGPAITVNQPDSAVTADQPTVRLAAKPSGGLSRPAMDDRDSVDESTGRARAKDTDTLEASHPAPAGAATTAAATTAAAGKTTIADKATAGAKSSAPARSTDE
ncbi:S8 family serine peptidase [Micromonospora sp. NPDC003197]